jgi:Bacterial SH3 domain
MRCMAFVLAGLLLLSGPGLGAEGDVLTVVGDNVNVRAGPGTEHAVTRQVSRYQRLLELERQGDWVRAEITGTGGAAGWIHASLVAPSAEPARSGAAEPAAAAADPAAAAGEADPGQQLGDLNDAAAAADAGPGAPESIVPGAGIDVDAVDLQRFRDSVAYLNSRSMLVGGSELFTGVEPLGAGAVQVGASEAWASMPPAGQRSYASALLDRWAAATGRSDQVKVQIVDDGGRVIMEESRP